ncbi:hypothetical protein GCM10023322_57580 [Rugosimonospora acidiphila]|uniref:DUF4232 domain-containing protein n=1 Tax=Rugosimonospora acidiphila TaxID=556531 RepID=A0ABP9SF98_9ACTN
MSTGRGNGIAGKVFGALAGAILLATQLTACAQPGTVPDNGPGAARAGAGGAAAVPPRNAAPPVNAATASASETMAANGSPPPCPASGVRIVPEDPQAAAGTRTLELDLVNCGSQPYTVGGYPSIQVLSADRRPFAVTVTHRPAFGASPDPGTITASPGHGPFVILEWHDIVTNGTPVTGAYLQIVPREGDPAQLVVPPRPIDLGTTGTLQTTPWAG